MIRVHPETPFIVDSEHDGHHTYYYWCPGCKSHDAFTDAWQIEKWSPLTISPSVRMSQGGRGSGRPEVTLCHVFIKNGVIEYLADCRHELKGTKVPMELPHLDHFAGLREKTS